MSETLWQVAGILTVIILFATVLARPDGVLVMVLAVGVVVAAIVVTWEQVEAYRMQRAAGVGVVPPQAMAGVTVPPPNAAHSGT